jgi:LysM repeat protein
MVKRIFQGMVVLAILVASFGSVGGALAWSNCPNYITVQWGDTLSGIAVQCGITVQAIRSANPGLGWWVYAGQILCIPSGYTSPVSQPTYGGTYTVQWGDTLGKIAGRSGTSVSSILAVNPQIWDPSLIYAGQVINLPGGVSVPPPPYNPPPTKPPDYPSPPSDSLSSVKIAYKHGMYIRSAPGGTIIASALNDEAVYYRPASLFTDSKGKVWVEVKLFPPAKGYTMGWLLVKDQFGTYFTEPPLGN